MGKWRTKNGQKLYISDKGEILMGKDALNAYHADRNAAAPPEPDNASSSSGSVVKFLAADDDAATSYMNKTFKDVKNSLTPEELVAARKYKSPAYHEINQQLRGEAKKANPKLEPQLENLTAAIKKNPLPEDTTLYRGMNLNAATVANLKPGSEFVNHGYVSTSLSPSIASNFVESEHKWKSEEHVIMEIVAKKGTPAFPIDKIKNTGELEMVLDKGTKFRVLDIKSGIMTQEEYNKKIRPISPIGFTLDGLDERVIHRVRVEVL